ncbi:hypothetical protein [Ilumatobacter coccineus]|uniref:Uncharacterized protein n=1 Tax=Ilumatobacter coccineus (strain NBRC 103263 / KCTC 29153 / YM16-304) TaxID=1313172 RepID=A0A6C7E5K4_ILUCY|nr:hypothetical protein [Ilumatobacter coccineus]BAN01810.1 hypothetical protein YM304_14960 [Ilumatobacter coccineus YM16-304]
MTISSASTAPGSASIDVRSNPPETTIGVTGLRPRWSVSAWGAVSPWLTDDDADDVAVSPVLDWYVAADDRWHVPADEPTIRQRRIEGTPVLETRLRIPDGDAIQRVWAVPDAGGTVVVEFENESPLPIAVSVAGMDVVTERPTSDVPIQGIELPDDAIVLPVGHHATVRVLLRSANSSGGFGSIPPAMSVVRGWTRVTEQASRLVLPDEALVDAVNAARCDLLLEGPVDPDADPVGFLLDVAELVRCGDSAEAWLLEIVEPVERVARETSAAADASDRREAFDAVRSARLIAQRAGDERASADLERLAADLAAGRSGRRWWKGRSGDVDRADTAPAASTPPALSSLADVRRSTSVGRFVRSIERRIVDVVDPVSGGASLLPGGVPTGWLGTNFEVHGIPTGPVSTASFAIRWHGERPAVLWEQHQGEVRLDSPTIDPEWSTVDASGETLWAAPAVPKAARSSLMVTAVDDATAPAADSDEPDATPPNTAPGTGILSIDPDGGTFA